LVVAEGHGWFLRRYDSRRALEFLHFIEDLTCLRVASIEKKELDLSQKYLKQYSDQKLTLADACGLLLMDHQKIERCWSTDFHLSLTGRILAIHEII
jgi:predicted nucleic acid-binding protein